MPLPLDVAKLLEELAALKALVEKLQAENAELHKALQLERARRFDRSSEKRAVPPEEGDPVQGELFNEPESLAQADDADPGTELDEEADDAAASPSDKAAKRRRRHRPSILNPQPAT